MQLLVVFLYIYSMSILPGIHPQNIFPLRPSKKTYSNFPDNSDRRLRFQAQASWFKGFIKPLVLVRKSFQKKLLAK
jgi:hypothetical protein